MLSDFHKLRRYIWCRNHIYTNFEKFIFGYECTVRLFEIPLYHVRPRTSRPQAFCRTSKLRLKVNIWGGISFNGATEFAVGFYL